MKAEEIEKAADEYAESLKSIAPKNLVGGIMTTRDRKMSNKPQRLQLNILAVIYSVSWLGLSNKLLFQWFFVRLTRCQEK